MAYHRWTDLTHKASDFNRLRLQANAKHKPGWTASSTFVSLYRGFRDVNSVKLVTMETLFNDHRKVKITTALLQYFGQKRALLGWGRHPLKLIFNMINDTCYLQGNVRALLMLGEENWTALDKGMGGPHSPLWKPTCSVMLHRAAMPLRDQLSDLITMTWFPTTSRLSLSFFGLIIISSFCICFIRDNLSLPALMKW